MIKHLFKIAFRNLIKNKFISFIKFFGISLGISTSLIILLWIMGEFRVDKFHENIDDIYQVITVWNGESGGQENFGTNYALASVLEENFPDFKYTTRTESESMNMRVEVINDNEKNIFNVDDFLYADEWFTKVFSYPVISGNFEVEMAKPNVIFLTESMAIKFFGNTDVIGKTVNVESLNQPRIECRIAGVLEDCPVNSTIRFDCIASTITLDGVRHRTIDNWHGQYGPTYVLIEKNVDLKKLINRISVYYNQLDEDFEKGLSLTPLKTKYLSPRYGQGDIKKIYIYSIIALFILLSASINYINISVAESTKRIKEIAVRKVNGALKKQLRGQFIAESFFLSTVSIIFILFFIWLIAPIFNEIIGGYSQFEFRWDTLLFIVVGSVLISLSAGLYPAFYLSSLNAMNSKQDVPKSKSNIRKILTILQFTISVVLVICSILVNQQLSFISDKDIGISTDLVVTFPMTEIDKYETLKQELQKENGISSVSTSLAMPTNIQWTAERIEWDGRSDLKNLPIKFNCVDYDYTETLDIEIKEGRSFSKDFGSDERSAIINEAAVKVLNLVDPVGKEFTIWNWYTGTIVGVSEDFHFESLKTNIKPIILVKGLLTQFDNVYVKISPLDISNTLKKIENVWKKLNPDLPFVSSFLDQELDKVYTSERNMGDVFGIFTLIAIFIACFGLFGLTSILASQRTKEIGIRKVLGAKVSNIIIIMMSDVVKWVIVANIIAIPIAYYFMNKWLQTFFYKIEIEYWVFILAGSISIIIAFFSVLFHTLKASYVNPIDVIGQE